MVPTEGEEPGELDLSHHQLTSGSLTQRLLSFHRSLVYLNLSNNSAIGICGFQSLSEWLVGNKHLVELKIVACGTSPEECGVLSKGVAQNTGLRRLTVDYTDANNHHYNIALKENHTLLYLRYHGYDPSEPVQEQLKNNRMLYREDCILEPWVCIVFCLSFLRSNKTNALAYSGFPISRSVSWYVQPVSTRLAGFVKFTRVQSFCLESIFGRWALQTVYVAPKVDLKTPVRKRTREEQHVMELCAVTLDQCEMLLALNNNSVQETVKFYEEQWLLLR